MKKMHLIKFVSFLLCLSMVATGFAGCFSSKTKEDEESSKESSEESSSSQPEEPEKSSGVWDMIGGHDGVIESIVPTKESALGVHSDTSFRIRFSEEFLKEELVSFLLFEPDLGDYTLEGQGKEWLITPVMPLDNNRVYSVKTAGQKDKERSESFAFQTRQELHVSYTYPASGYDDLGLTSGIEIVFNEKEVDISKHFEIEPSVMGTFVKDGNKTSFVPTKELEPDTNYRVTIQSGAKNEKGLVLEEDYVFSFSTEGDVTLEKGFHFLESYSTSHLPEDELLFQVYAYGYYKSEDEIPMEYSAKIYSYSNIKKYEEEIRDYYGSMYTTGRRTKSKTDTDGLSLVAKYDSVVFFRPDDYSRYVVLPENLKAGHYFLEVTVGTGKEAQIITKMFSISPYNIYMQTVNDELLVWVNDTATGLPVGGGEIHLEEAPDRYNREKKEMLHLSGRTDDAGILTLGTGEINKGYLSVSIDNQLQYFEQVPLRSYYYASGAKEQKKHLLDYYTFLYTDRSQYKPSEDSISFWGTVIPRRDEVKIPKTVYAALASYEKESQKIILEVDEYGTYRGEFNFSDLESNYNQIKIQDKDGNLYHSTYIQLREYEKPEYLIEVESDKTSYYYGDTVTVSVSASYYDGTPLKGVELDVVSELFEAGTTVLLDNDGKGTVSGIVSDYVDFSEKRNWLPFSVRIGVTNARIATDVVISQSTSVDIRPSKVAAAMNYDLEEGIFKAETALIDWDKMKNVDFSALSADEKTTFKRHQGASTDIPIKIEVYQRTFTKTVRETYYDKMNKKTVTLYDYDSTEKIVETLSGTTKNGVIQFSDKVFLNSQTVRYRAEMSFESYNGRRIFSITDLPYWYTMWEVPTSYSFFKRDQTRSLKIGEDIPLGLYLGDEKVPMKKGKVLFTIAREGIEITDTYGASGSKWTMTKASLPNVAILGAYFDGKNIHPISRSTLSYNYSERELSLEIAPNKESYRPGEKAVIKVSLKDAKGNPVLGKAVVGIVDESAFAVDEQYIHMISSLYTPIFMPRTWQGVSNRLVDLDVKEDAIMSESSAEAAVNRSPASGGGDGGEVRVRKEFVDTAFFETAETNEKGEATVTFNFPDNITAWRVTALAITKNVDAGNEAAQVISTLPYYINTSISSAYVVGDDIVVGMDGIGTGVNLGEAASYHGEVKNSEGVVIKETRETSAIGTRLYMNFGKLAIGNYKVTLRGGSGSYQDGIEKDISVVETGLSIQHTRLLPIKDWSSISPLRYPVGITAFDSELAPYFEVLNALRYARGERIEVIISAYQANMIWYELSGEQYRKPYKPQVVSEIAAGNLSSFPALEGSDGDIDTTAKLAVSASELLDKKNTVVFFEEVLKSQKYSTSDRAMALMGMANAKEPVLLDIYQELAGNDQLTAKDRLYLGTALALLGDQAGAEKIYLEETKELVTEDETAYLSGETVTETNELTAAALLLSSYLDSTEYQEQGETLALHLVRAPFDKEQSTPYEPELMSFINQFSMPKGNEESTITYPDETGASKTVSLQNEKNNLFFFLGKEEFENKKVTTTGAVSFLVNYREYAQNISTPDLFTVTKEIIGETKELKVGEIATISFSIVPAKGTEKGRYRITDFLPSGMRYYVPPNTSRYYYSGDHGDFHYMYAEGQEVSGMFYYDGEVQSVEGYYQASVVLPGEYISGGAAIQDKELIAVAKGETTTIAFR